MPDEHVPLQDFNTDMFQNAPVVLPITWRQRTFTNDVPAGGAEDVGRFTPAYSPFGGSDSIGSWTVGGASSATRTVCYKVQIQEGFWGTRKSFAAIPSATIPGAWAWISTVGRYTITDANIEIDWESTLAPLRASFPEETHYIVHATFTDSLGEGNDDLVGEGFVNLNQLNSIYKDPAAIALFNEKPVFGLTASGEYETHSRDLGASEESETAHMTDGSLLVNGLNNDETDTTFSDEVADLHNINPGIGGCVSSSRSVNMYLKVWVNIHLPASVEEPEEIAQSEEPPDDSETDNPGDWSSSSGSSASGSGFGSGSQGVNRSFTMYGSNSLGFDSVYLTGTDYNNFVAAGSGIIGESGVYPGTDCFYIESIRLSVEGSTMTVIEVVDFDATPSLSENEKVFAYIINSDNQNKPVFTGYVTSKQRRMNGKTEEIVYECSDVTYYLDQFHTPSHFLYSPPSSNRSRNTKTYDRILKELLNIAGFQDAILDMPADAAPPTEWVYQPLRSVLEWATDYLGNFVYYADRYGRLNVRATDSGSVVKSYRIPTRGEAVGDHIVADFGPISDFSRSRSRVVLAGDFPMVESEYRQNLKAQGPRNPKDANATGFYWYYDQINVYGYNRFFYFVFATSKELSSSLLTDPSKSVVVTMTITTKLSGVGSPPGLESATTIELPVASFQTSPNRSKIIAKFDKSLLPTGAIIPTELGFGFGGDQGNSTYTFTVRYASKGRDPIQVQCDTGLTGGVEVIRRPEFKKISSGDHAVNDTPLMERYLNQIKKFYRPVYGGTLKIEALDTTPVLLDKVSITNTSLPSAESNGLIVYGITYNLVDRTTTFELSNKVYQNLPFFDPTRDRVRRNNQSEVRLTGVENKFSTLPGHAEVRLNGV